jgi:AcrR family transcriptional regulator
MAIRLDRNKILDVCRAEVAKHGFRKASLTDIARHLGVVKTALYHHFPGGKRELMNALIQREEDIVLHEMRETLKVKEDPKKMLRNLILAKLTHFHRLRDLFDVIIDVGEEVANIYYEHKTAFHSAELGIIQSVIKTGQELNIFRPSSNVMRLASSIQSVLHHLELPLVFNSRKDMEKEVDELLAVLFYGIAAK